MNLFTDFIRPLIAVFLTETVKELAKKGIAAMATANQKRKHYPAPPARSSASANDAPTPSLLLAFFGIVALVALVALVILAPTFAQPSPDPTRIPGTTLIPTRIMPTRTSTATATSTLAEFMPDPTPIDTPTATSTATATATPTPLPSLTDFLICCFNQVSTRARAGGLSLYTAPNFLVIILDSEVDSEETVFAQGRSSGFFRSGICLKIAGDDPRYGWAGRGYVEFLDPAGEWVILTQDEWALLPEMPVHNRCP